MHWQHTLPPTRAALVSAALRHVNDAYALLDASPVQALHLAGFGPECARKAAISAGASVGDALDKAIGHGFHPVAELALTIACDLDSLSSRYDLSGWGARFTKLAGWSESVRYKATNSHPAREVRATVEEAAEAVSEVVAALWCDGRLASIHELMEVRA